MYDSGNSRSKIAGSAVIFEGGEHMKLSARNVLKGKVKSIKHGAVNSEVVVQLPDGLEITSVITKTSVENLSLKEGKDVYAIVKATNVILGVD
jgi:molybdopterin-binding protein